MKQKKAKNKQEKQKDSRKANLDRNEDLSEQLEEESKLEKIAEIEIPAGSDLMKDIIKRLEEEEQKDDENNERDPSEVILRKRDLKASQKGRVNIEKLIYEHEKKKLALEEALKQKQEKQEELAEIREDIGKKIVSMEPVLDRKYHWKYLLSEMKWMSNDFERERKDQKNNGKKLNRACKKKLDEKKHHKIKQRKEEKMEIKRKANAISKMIQKFWKSCEKVIKHNYNVDYEMKKQRVREKKLNHFVNQHLKLSNKVVSSLHEKTKIASAPLVKHDEKEEKGPIVVEHNEALPVMGSKVGDDHRVVEEESSNKTTITVKKLPDGRFEYVSHNIPPQEESQSLSSQEQQKLAEEQIEMAAQFQPLAHDLEHVHVKTRIPFLLRGNLREYQVIGLDWLKTLHDKKLNGILADEMGLGKTIQTISLLASLACDEGVWGPHLIVVPTTIIINWEMEFKRWCPGLKILTYFGSQKERKLKRTGWSKDNSFHVCITSYKLVIQDHFAFKRKKWYYMVLDEAQNIKNFRSQRWQTLLRFNTKRRLLLTGTPLQNDVMELWSLMHFLMPHIFSSHQDFKEWFSNPFNQSMNQSQSLNMLVVQRLQSILRPFLLRRMKKDVEKQLPEKIEHIVKCDLSRRQRFLYDEYINNNRTQHTLQQADFFSIMNVLMQLRKVCNHPDLFEARPIESPFFQEESLIYRCPKLIWNTLTKDKDNEFLFDQLCMILRKGEQDTKKAFASRLENFPQRSFVEALQYARQNNNGKLSTVRPLEEGDAVGLLKPINCNELSVNNTEALSISFPSSLPFTYINSASMPFLSSYFSMDSLDQLRYDNREIKFNPDTDYISALQVEDTKKKMMKFGEKLITFAHADYRNRMKLMSSPVYGKDCIEACKIPLTFDNLFRHKKGRSSKSIKNLEVPQTIFNPLCNKKIKHEIMYNRFSNKTFCLENAPIYEDVKLDRKDSQTSKDARSTPTKKVMRQPGFPLVIELKAKKHKGKSKSKLKGGFINMPYKPKIDTNLSPVYSNMHGKVMYVMSAKLIKNVTISFPKSILGKKNEEYSHSTVSEDVNVDIKETVVHKKKPVKVGEETVGLYEKEYNTTSEYRRMKNIEAELNENEDEGDDECMEQDQPSQAQDQPQEKIQDQPQEQAQDQPKEQEQTPIEQDKEVESEKAPQAAEPSEEKPQETEQEDKTNTPEKANGDAKSEPKQEDKIESKEGDEKKPEEAKVNGTLQEEEPKDSPKVVEDSDKQKEDVDMQVDSKPQEESEKQKDTENIDANGHVKDQEKDKENENTQNNQNTTDQQKSDTDKKPDANNENKEDQEKGTPDNNNEDDDESDEEYSGEGCFIGYRNSDTLRNMVVTPMQRYHDWLERLKHFKFITPKTRAKPAELNITKVDSEYEKRKEYENIVYKKVMSHRTIRGSLKFTNSLYFPHRNLVQYDCGKLHKLSILLKTLKAKGSKVLIFTQMTKMLDLLEQFLNLHGYTYVRLDGSVKVEMRQRLVDNFNLNKKIFCFISSTRCGGIGINLTGADCVVFYDTDWNPAMDKQAQDRCHRIGQEKTVHIYRLISLNTIEENIFKKSLQKRELGGMIIEGNFDPEFFKKVNYKELLEDGSLIKPKKLDIMKEENIVFSDGIEEAKDDKEAAEAYRRKYEEVLIRVEDQEDVDAYQNAKREIDDEFEEVDTGSPTAKGSAVTGADEEKKQEVKKKVHKEENQDEASKTLSGVKRYEVIDWKENENLNSITKQCINYVKSSYSFDDFLQDKSEKDAKFIDPEEEYKLQKEREEEERQAEDQGSEFSEISTDRENYNADEARELYKIAQQEIPVSMGISALYQ